MREKMRLLKESALRHKKRTAVIGLACAVFLVLIAVRLGGGGRKAGGPGGPQMAGQADNMATVNAENPKTGSIERTTSTSGTVEASDVVYVYAKASGDVTKVGVSAGQMVEAGQLLCTIDTEQVESAKNTMDSAAISLSEASGTRSRMQLLYEAGAISDQEWEQYQNAEKTAKLNYESAKLNYNKQVEYSSITSPISGKVETFDLDVYDHVNQQDTICVISGEGEKRVSFYVTERVIQNLNQGDGVIIEKNGSSYDGTITDVSAIAEEGNGLFKVKAELPEADALSAGTSVRITVVSERADQVMTVPVDAIYYDGGVGQVYVYENGTVHKKEVEVGLYDSQLAEIKSGLSGEELVISTWSSQLYEGSTVRLQGQDSAVDGENPEIKENGGV
ncbi:MAG: efflux RND transporter periplasmic adaptor subunit [Clostridium sp.]|jgi:multidrug efflux system membrane fusion protein